MGICLQVQIWKWGRLCGSTRHPAQMWGHPGTVWTAALWHCLGNGSSATCQNCSITFRISGYILGEGSIVSCRCPMCCSALQLRIGKPHLLADKHSFCCFPSHLQITQGEGTWNTWMESFGFDQYLFRPVSVNLTGRSQLGELYSCARICLRIRNKWNPVLQIDCTGNVKKEKGKDSHDGTILLKQEKSVNEGETTVVDVHTW